MTVKSGFIPKGTVAGMHHRWEAFVDGAPVLVYQSYAYGRHHHAAPTTAPIATSSRSRATNRPVSARARQLDITGDIGYTGRVWTAMKRDQHDPAGGRRPTGDPDPPRPPARHAARPGPTRVGMTPPASEELERELVDWLASLTGTDDLTITRRTGGASRRVHRRRPARRRNHASSGSAPTPASAPSRRRATACDVRPPSTRAGPDARAGRRAGRRAPDPPGVRHATSPARAASRRSRTAPFESIAKQFVDQLATLHRLEPAALDLPELGPLGTLSDHVLDEIAEWDQQCASAGGGVPVVSLATAWLRTNLPGADGWPVVLVQGDTGPGNFMFHGDQLVAVTDWEPRTGVTSTTTWRGSSCVTRSSASPTSTPSSRTTSASGFTIDPASALLRRARPVPGDHRNVGRAALAGPARRDRVAADLQHAAQRGYSRRRSPPRGSEHRHVRHRARRRRRTLVGLRHRARRPARRRAPRRRRRLRRDAKGWRGCWRKYLREADRLAPGFTAEEGESWVRSSVTRSTTSRPGAPLCAGDRAGRARRSGGAAVLPAPGRATRRPCVRRWARSPTAATRRWAGPRRGAAR